MNQVGGSSPVRIIETYDNKQVWVKYEEWKRYYFNKTNKSFISDMFYAHLVDMLRCKSCGKIKYSFSFFSALALEINDSIMKSTMDSYTHPPLNRANSLNSEIFSIDDLVKKYFQPESIEGYKCNYCGKTSTVVKQQFMLHAPKILLVYFKRFNMMEAVPRKLNTKIKVNDLICMDLKHSYEENGVYDLMAFIMHLGDINSGHYISTIRKGNHWVAISDDKAVADDLYHISKLGSSEVYLCAFSKHRGD